MSATPSDSIIRVIAAGLVFVLFSAVRTAYANPETQTARHPTGPGQKSVQDGLYIRSGWSAQYSDNFTSITISVPEIVNASNTTGYNFTSGDLRLEYWATTDKPARGDTFRGYRLAVFPSLGTLSPGASLVNVQQTTSIVAPPDGTYWLVLILQEYYPSGCTSSDSYCMDDSIPSDQTRTFGATPIVEDKSREVVEYYRADLDHYFMTLEGDESVIVDSGVVGPWERTGEAFQAWGSLSDAPAGATPVYRFYSYTQNSHFYTGSEAEKDHLVSLNPRNDHAVDWVYEGIAFYAFASDEKVAYCGSNRSTVQRAYNNGYNRNGANHRYFMNPDIAQLMQQRGWTPEGTRMCYIRTPVLRVRPTPATCGVGVPCSAQIAKAFGGTPPYVFFYTPTVFAGLTVSADGTGPNISGTPTTPGVYTVDVTVRDAASASWSTRTTVRVESAPKVWLSASSFIICYRDERCDVTGIASASGGRGSPFTFTSSGMPPGLSLRSVSTYADVVGIPTTAGLYQATITAVDRLSIERTTKAMIVHVYDPVNVQGLVAGCTLNVFCSVPVATASGGYTGFPGEPPYSFYLYSPSPPPGIVITTSIDGTTGLGTGRPTIAGVYAFQVCAYDRNGHGCTGAQKAAGNSSITVIDTGPSACSYTYSDWGPCQSNNMQTRTVISSRPTGCIGTPVTSQACTYMPPSSGQCSYGSGYDGSGGGVGHCPACSSAVCLVNEACHGSTVGIGQACVPGVTGCPANSYCMYGTNPQSGTCRTACQPGSCC